MNAYIHSITSATPLSCQNHSDNCTDFMPSTVRTQAHESSVDVFQFSDFRHFIKIYIREKQKIRKSYSVAVLARLSDMGPAMLRLVLSGKRNLSGESIQKLANALRLSPTESRFFEILVRLNQEKSPIIREILNRAIREFID